MLAAIFAIQFIVGTHHRRDAGVERGLEMRQVDLVQRAFVDPHIDPEAGILHRIEREMLHRCHHILGLDAEPERSAHRAQMMRILAIGFLCTAPRRVAEKVDADGARQVAILRAHLLAHRLADPHFEVGVEGRAARHGAWKAGALPARDPARSVGEPQRGDTQPFDPAAGAIGACAPQFVVGDEIGKKTTPRQHADLFDECRLGDDRLDRLGDPGVGRAAAGGEIMLGRVGHRASSVVSRVWALRRALRHAIARTRRAWVRASSG